MFFLYSKSQCPIIFVRKGIIDKCLVLRSDRLSAIQKKEKIGESAAKCGKPAESPNIRFIVASPANFPFFTYDCPIVIVRTMSETGRNAEARPPRKDSKWEILTSLDRGTKYNIVPKPLEGFLAKRRKWPMKGWHKRFFILDKGSLVYGKTEAETHRGRTHGRIDVGLACISAKTEVLRIDINDDECIHHLRSPDIETFGIWLERLQQHRFYQQNVLNESSSCDAPISPAPHEESVVPRGSTLQEFQSMDDRMTQHLVLVQKQAVALSLLAQKFEDEMTSSSSGRRSLFAFRKKKEGDDQESVVVTSQRNSLSSSTSTLVAGNELMALSQEIQTEISNMVRNYSADRDRVKMCLMENQQSGTLNGMVTSLRHSLNQVLVQNVKLKARLQKIHLDADVSDLPAVHGAETLMSHKSSVAEFFDACEYNTDVADDDDDEEDDEEESSDEDPFLGAQEVVEKPVEVMMWTGRRTTLPSVAPTTSGTMNLWNLLCKNIGKDLSKISMPVTLNEPLSTLQRLCEELEYSELLDKASGSSHQMERMMWVACFAVSAYGCCNHRAGYKPFNPLLGETFECVREDRGFRFVAEQVSHHPPITACHAHSKNWAWWQDFRVKTKFWGKSMEFQPEASVNVEIAVKEGSWKEVYSWNKVTTCIHNLFGNAERWADLYGECVIKCRRKGAPSGDDAPVSVCNLEFLSGAGYWTNNQRHEVKGTIKDSSGKVVQNIFGKCTEALYCGDAPSVRCIWRPGSLPEDSAMFYGFSRFAIELNEILETERELLPPTDTRFRPDQRCLEVLSLIVSLNWGDV